MSKMQRHIIKWTVICTIPATILASVFFKFLGIDDLGWGGGIGAGVGIGVANIIATKTMKSDESAEP